MEHPWNSSESALNPLEHPWSFWISLNTIEMPWNPRNTPDMLWNTLEPVLQKFISLIWAKTNKCFLSFLLLFIFKIVSVSQGTLQIRNDSLSFEWIVTLGTNTKNQETFRQTEKMADIGLKSSHILSNVGPLLHPHWITVGSMFGLVGFMKTDQWYVHFELYDMNNEQSFKSVTTQFILASWGSIELYEPTISHRRAFTVNWVSIEWLESSQLILWWLIEERENSLNFGLKYRLILIGIDFVTLHGTLLLPHENSWNAPETHKNPWHAPENANIP